MTYRYTTYPPAPDWPPGRPDNTSPTFIPLPYYDHEGRLMVPAYVDEGPEHHPNKHHRASDHRRSSDDRSRSSMDRRTEGHRDRDRSSKSAHRSSNDGHHSSSSRHHSSTDKTDERKDLAPSHRKEPKSSSRRGKPESNSESASSSASTRPYRHRKCDHGRHRSDPERHSSSRGMEREEKGETRSSHREESHDCEERDAPKRRDLRRDTESLRRRFTLRWVRALVPGVPPPSFTSPPASTPIMGLDAPQAPGYFYPQPGYHAPHPPPPYASQPMPSLMPSPIPPPPALRFLPPLPSSQGPSQGRPGFWRQSSIESYLRSRNWGWNSRPSTIPPVNMSGRGANRDLNGERLALDTKPQFIASLPRAQASVKDRGKGRDRDLPPLPKDPSLPHRADAPRAYHPTAAQGQEKPGPRGAAGWARRRDPSPSPGRVLNSVAHYCAECGRLANAALRPRPRKVRFADGTVPGRTP